MAPGDGSLTYNEFMVKLSNLPLPAKIQLKLENTKEAAGKLLMPIDKRHNHRRSFSASYRFKRIMNE